MLKFIVVLPFTARRTDLHRYGERRFTWLNVWQDLHELSGKVVFGDLRLFVEHSNPDSAPPKLFVAALADGTDRDEAFVRGVSKILSLRDAFIYLLGHGLEPQYHEAVTTPYSPFALPPSEADTVTIRDIEVIVGAGRVSEVKTRHGGMRSRAPFTMTIGPDSTYAKTYVVIPQIEGPFNYVARINKRSVLTEFETHACRVKENAEKQGWGADLFRTVAALYSAAITVQSMPVSFLLLWQVLEALASMRDPGSRLLPSEVLEKIAVTLRDVGVDATSVTRVLGALGTLRGRGQVELMADLLQEVSPDRDRADIIRTVNGYRKVRGKVAHGVASDPVEPALLETYADLRTTVRDLLLRLVPSDLV